MIRQFYQFITESKENTEEEIEDFFLPVIDLDNFDHVDIVSSKFTRSIWSNDTINGKQVSFEGLDEPIHLPVDSYAVYLRKSSEIVIENSTIEKCFKKINQSDKFQILSSLIESSLKTMDGERIQQLIIFLIISDKRSTNPHSGELKIRNKLDKEEGWYDALEDSETVDDNWLIKKLMKDPYSDPDPEEASHYFKYQKDFREDFEEIILFDSAKEIVTELYNEAKAVVPDLSKLMVRIWSFRNKRNSFYSADDVPGNFGQKLCSYQWIAKGKNYVFLADSEDLNGQVRGRAHMYRREDFEREREYRSINSSLAIK